MDVFGDPVGGAAWRLDCARALACALACLSSGCFKGDAAQGLPCEQDRDCGVDDRCVAGFCGGPPDGATAGETSGSSSGGSGSTTDIPAGCGNGMADPGEQCEPAVAGTPDADCDIDCTLPLCGDGLVNGYALNTAVGDGVSVEQCDPGSVDADDCDVDCTIPECGDGHFNDQAETCDDDNAVEVDACTNACQPTLLAADFDDGALEGWTVEAYDLSQFGVADLPGWATANGRVHSGAVPQITNPGDQYAYPGITILRTPPLAIPEAGALPSGFRMELHFAHELYVDACGNFAQGDGGVVRVLVDGQSELLSPVGAYPNTLADYCDPPGTDHPPNPLTSGGGAAFSGMRSGAVAFDLSGLSGMQVQLEFVFGVDCVQCVDDTQARGWWIDDVVVAPFPMP